MRWDADGVMSYHSLYSSVSSYQQVTKPRLLFADEPTTGLDSFSANTIMRVLARYCHSGGMCCIAAIHQPPINTWRMVDRVMVLTR
jgi:ABC-type multidrug transport system ATPase subunit